MWSVGSVAVLDGNFSRKAADLKHVEIHSDTKYRLSAKRGKKVVEVNRSQYKKGSEKQQWESLRSIDLPSSMQQDLICISIRRHGSGQRLQASLEKCKERLKVKAPSLTAHRWLSSSSSLSLSLALWNLSSPPDSATELETFLQSFMFRPFHLQPNRVQIEADVRDL